MAVYREGYDALEMLQKNQQLIYPGEAADYGVPVKKNDELWKAVKQLVEWYRVKGTRVENKYSTGTTVRETVELMNEWAVSDGRMTVKQATERWRITFVGVKRGIKLKGNTYIGYVEIMPVK